METNPFEHYWIEAEAAKLERERRAEQGRMYQLALWPDTERAMPADFVACALFGAIQGKHSVYVKRQQLASVNGITVIFTGQRLTQVHADVWQGIMHLARQQSEGRLVRFTAGQLLRLIGRHTGKAQHEQLKVWLAQLGATMVEIQDDAKRRRFFGSLLPRGGARDEQDDSLYAIEISRDLARVLSGGFGTIDWRQRERLMNKPLALWLQIFFSRFRKPASVELLHALSGSGATVRRFRQHLAKALDDLHRVGGHSASIDRGTDRVVPNPEARAPRPHRAPRGPGQQRVLPFERPSK